MCNRIVLLVALVLSGMKLSAQSDFKEDWNSLFEPIRLSGMVSNACLWEYGLTDTVLFNWKGKDEEAVMDFDIWSTMYDHWRNSVMDTLLMPVDRRVAFQHMNSYFKRGVVVVPALLASGYRFKKSSVEHGEIYLDSVEANLKFKELNGLLMQDYFFASAPLVHCFFERQAKLFFSDTFFFTNSGLSVAEVQMKLNESAFVKVEMNQDVNVDLLPGQNTLIVQWAFSNGLLYKSKFILSQLEFEAGYGNDQLMAPIIGDAARNIYTEPFRTTELEEPLGAYIEVLPGLNNGVANACIRKPIIFVEGIDFGYEGHETGCYGGKCGSMGLRDLMRGRVFHPHATKVKDLFEDWEPIRKAPELISQLRNAGYDLIYLDFHNGADYIENNAMLLVELIKRVNHVKCSKEEIVIIGASMGGLLSSFALSYMEQNQIPHCVRTYISFDAPHNGANIPLGIQHCLLYYRKKLPGIKDAFDRKLDRAASRQMLVEHSLSENGYKEHGDRIDFLSKRERLGKFPVKCRKVCLSNGSIKGIGQSFNSGDVLLRVNPYLGRFNFDILEVNATVWATYAMVEGKNVVLSALYPLSKKRVVTVPYDIHCYDHQAGSTRFDLQESRAIYGVFNVINKEDATCFIPTQSSMALTYDGFGEDLSATIPTDRPDPKHYPFDAYFGEDISQEHMMLTDNNIKWLMDQIEANKNELTEVLDTYYNFGRFERNCITDVVVMNHGVLGVNLKGMTGYGNGRFDKETLDSSKFFLKTSDCGAYLTVENGGEFVLGSDKNHIGVFNLGKGATLEFRPGSKLIIRQNSELIIEEDAELIIHPGVQIVLDGSNAVLRLDGQLKLMDQTVLKIEKEHEKVNGFIHIRAVKGGYGNAKIIVNGPNVSIDLKGSDINCQVLQMEGNISIGNENPLKMFKVSNAKLAYGNLSGLSINGNAEFEKVKFVNLPWATKLTQTALTLRNFEICKLKEVRFEDFKFAVVTSSDNEFSKLELKNAEFVSCITGLFLHNDLAFLKDCRFTSCIENAVLTSGILKELVLESNQFNGNKSCIKMDNSGNDKGVMFASDLSFSSNDNSIECNNIEICLTCCRFISNGHAITAKNTDLNISKDHLSSGLMFTERGGNNTFYQSTGVSIQMDGGLLYLNNGNNNFIDKSSSVAPIVLKGKVDYSLLTHEVNAPYALKGSGNYWQPWAIGDLKDASLVLYDLKSMSKVTGINPCLIKGSLLSQVNTYCYQSSGCNPCGIAEEPGLDVIELGDSTMYGIQVYPYPSNDHAVIRNPYGLPMQVGLLTLEGKKIQAYQFDSAPEVVLDIRFIQDGLYLLEIICDDIRLFKPMLIRH